MARLPQQHRIHNTDHSIKNTDVTYITMYDTIVTYITVKNGKGLQ